MSASPAAALTGPADAAFSYEMYGLDVASDFRLPTQPSARHGSAAPDVVFRRMDVPAPVPRGRLVAELRCHGPCHRGQVYSRVYRSEHGSWLVNPGVAACFVAPAGDVVDVYPEPNAAERELGLLLAGELSTVLLQQRGRPCLHASAVALDGSAIAFLGPQGRGKSTMAALFVSHGAALLTDDILALHVGDGRVEASPGLPMMKLWHQSVQGTLRLDDDLPNIAASIDKKILSVEGRYTYARSAACLTAMYVLERYDPLLAGETRISIRRLVGREVISTLLAHTSHPEFLIPAQSANVLRTYASIASHLSVQVVRFPDGFDHQQSVYDRILADLKTA